MNCNTTKKGDTESKDLQPSIESDLLEGKWQLIQMTNLNVDFSQYDSAIPILVINKDSMKISGNDGCNEILGDLVLSNEDSVQFKSIGRTKIGCNLNKDYDDQFRSSLESTASFRILNDVLTVFDINQNRLLDFKRINN